MAGPCPRHVGWTMPAPRRGLRLRVAGSLANGTTGPRALSSRPLAGRAEPALGSEPRKEHEPACSRRRWATANASPASNSRRAAAARRLLEPGWLPRGIGYARVSHGL